MLWLKLETIRFAPADSLHDCFTRVHFCTVTTVGRTHTIVRWLRQRMHVDDFDSDTVESAPQRYYVAGGGRQAPQMC